MTDPNKAHITLIIDRSGSMQGFRSDAEGAIRAFIADQQKEPTPCTMLLADFDDQEPLRVAYDGDLAGCPEYRLLPRGTTPLLDAVGRGITVTGERLAQLPESERPGKVFFVVETDGFENASREWSRDRVVEAIKRQEDDYAWTFVFLRAGADAWAAAQLFDGTQMAHAHTINAAPTAAAYASAHRHTSSNVATARRGGTVADWAADIDDDGTVH